MMTPALRKFALTAHVTSSVGWLGAVAGFLVLAIAGLTSSESQIVAGTYLSMKLMGWFVIVPLSLASPLTGVALSLGTVWGLFRHRWIVAKVLITIPATILLMVHMQPVGHLARVVAETTLSQGEFAGLRIQLVAEAIAAMLVLIVATALSVYKPRGVTLYGREMQPGADASSGGWAEPRATTKTPGWVYVAGITAVLLVMLFVIMHLTGSGHSHH